MSESNITLSSTVLGTIGTVLWCIQLIPQIWHNWRRKKTDGFPAAMMFLWASCSVPMGAYLILQQVNIPLQVQPQIFGFFSLVSWGQVLYYNHEYSRNKAVLIPYNNGVTWPDIVVGVVAAILLSAGLLPPYFELWKRDGRVIGINWVFLSIDTLGGLFSLFALGNWLALRQLQTLLLTQAEAAQGSFDILGGIMYILVVVLEAGIYASHIVWRIRYRKLRQEAEASGQSIDDIIDMDRERTQQTQDPEKGVVSDVPSNVDMIRPGQPSTSSSKQRDCIQKF
ncbi:unnamed protein product [Penicillium bialowiezense]